LTVGENVTFNFFVTNSGPVDATGVTLTDTLPASTTLVSATGGVTPVNGVLIFTIGDLAAGATSGTFTIVVTSTVAGTLTNQASVSGNEFDPTPADNSATFSTSVAAAGPIVISLQRLGLLTRTTGLVLTFDTPLDPGRAEDLHNYQLVALGGSKRTIRIKSAVYNATTRTVTLSPVQRLNLRKRFQLTVVGTGPSGVADSSGNLLDGQKTGQPGSNFVTIVSAAHSVLTTAHPGR
jgi:uncharacterized repeat protein (TIGR01451 family)